MNRLWLIAAVSWLVLIQPARASYCYSAPYYSGYSYYQQPYYSYYPQYVSYPVASYVGIPIPIFGSIYTGPATPATTTTTTRTTTATAVVGNVTTTGTGGGGGGATAAETEILAGLKTLTSVVGRVAQQQTQQSADLAELKRDYADVRTRFVALEARVNGFTPGPVSPPGPRATQDAALPIYRSKCFACHQDGSASLIKNSTTKTPIVLFTKLGARAAVSDAWLLSMVDHVAHQTMPPRNNVLKIAQLTGDEQDVILLDLKKWPKKKE